MSSSSALTVALCLALCSTAVSLQHTASTCGYSACPKPVPGRLNVHLVPHTHDDVGWLRTVDQYYYYEVQFILDTVIEELLANADRKFTYVEIAYFYRWWREQPRSKQQQVKDLVQSGQLQFALGGWCMDDEATTHYVDIIDQHTQGLRFLNDTFGDCGRPRVAWQVDPFGHSKEHSAMLAQMGFDGLYFGRIDYQDEAVRMVTKQMEMLWQASEDIGSPAADLFSGTLFGSYCAPAGYTYENGDEPVQDDPNLHDYNVDRKVKEFITMVNTRHLPFRSNQLMLTMGCDFQYQNARKNFKIYDKLIKAVNDRKSQHNVTVFYSTPSCYTKAVHDDNLSWGTKTDDFFPYSHIPHGFWTGYFTSRAALKRYVRQSSNVFQTIKQLNSLAGNQRYFDADKNVSALRQAMGVVQHHDGVSGTEKQVVAFDYAQRISDGMAAALPLLHESWTKVTKDKNFGLISHCPLANISYCPFTDSHNSFYLQVHNPISHEVWQVVRVPVTGKFYVVSNHLKQIVTSQTIPVSNGTFRVPERSGAKSQFELVFNVSSIPAMGFVVYRIVAANQGQAGASTFTPIVPETADLPQFMEDQLEVKWRRIRPALGQLPVAMEMQPDGVVQTDMAYYYGFQGNNSKPQFTASGAYLFRPTKEYPELYKSVMSGSVTGPVVNEVHTSWSNYTYQVRRSYKSQSALSYEENELTVGPIPFADHMGREVIVRYNTSVKSASTFFTDANGRQILRRVRNFRPTWKLQQTEPVAGNYFPINSQIFINDSSSSFVVLTDRSQGGGSIYDGQLEVMLHRVTIDDDSLGVGEPLQERGSDGKGLVVKTTHWFFSDKSANSAAKRRELANRRFREPVLGFLQAEPQVKSWSAIRQRLPNNLQVISLEDWRNADMKLLRIEHMYQGYEDAVLSKPVTIDIAKLFTTFDIEQLTELTLAANQEKSKTQRLNWKIKDGQRQEVKGHEVEANGTTVTFKPMEIRTFAIKVKYL